MITKGRPLSGPFLVSYATHLAKSLQPEIMTLILVVGEIHCLGDGNSAGLSYNGYDSEGMFQGARHRALRENTNGDCITKRVRKKAMIRQMPGPFRC